MIINGRKLYDARPLTPMATMKLREHGVSYGLAEAGYDLRIKQSVTLHPFRRFALASTIAHQNRRAQGMEHPAAKAHGRFMLAALIDLTKGKQ